MELVGGRLTDSADALPNLHASLNSGQTTYLKRIVLRLQFTQYKYAKRNSCRPSADAVSVLVQQAAREGECRRSKYNSVVRCSAVGQPCAA